MTDDKVSKRASSSSWTTSMLWGTAATFALRFISFACTQVSYRYVDPSTLGQALIQLELLYSCTNFLAREGFRLAFLRYTGDPRKIAHAVAIPLHLFAAGLGAAWHWYQQQKQTSENVTTPLEDPLLVAGWMYCLASAVEGVGEPLILYALSTLQVSIKASAEGMATLGKTLALVLVLQHTGSDHILAFGCAQLVFSVVYTVYLYAQCGSKLPHWEAASSPLTDKNSQKANSSTSSLLQLTAVFSIQGFFKHLLTEADRIALVALAESYDQGVYAMGSAYGGLAARVLLQPVEENARLLWSRQRQQTVDQDVRTTDDPLYLSYCLVTKFVLYFGLAVSTLAIHYTHLLLSLRHSDNKDNHTAVQVLSAFCVYTAFMALNGTTEAFVYAVAPGARDMGRLSAIHTVIMAGFCGLAPVAVQRYGTVGLVGANCVAMLGRSVYSIHFAVTYFATARRSSSVKWMRLVRDMFPVPAVLLCFLGCFLVTRWSQSQMETLPHLAVGVSAGVGTLTIAFATEDKVRKSILEFWRARRSTPKEVKLD